MCVCRMIYDLITSGIRQRLTNFLLDPSHARGVLLSPSVSQSCNIGACDSVHTATDSMAFPRPLVVPDERS
jgi:hypothetical protein